MDFWQELPTLRKRPIFSSPVFLMSNKIKNFMSDSNKELDWGRRRLNNLLLMENALNSSVRLSYSKLEYSTSFNPQNSNSDKLELKKTRKIRITRAKTRNTWVKFELDTCSNSTVWNLIKLELDKNWAWSGTSTL